MRLSPIARILPGWEVCCRYGIGRRKLKRLIRDRRLLTVEGLSRLRIYDPAWTAAVGLTVNDLEDVPVFRCGEVAMLLGISSRMVRGLAAEGKIHFRVVEKRRYFALAAVREVREARERGEQGRRKRGVRPWMVKWAKEQLRRPTLPGEKPFRAA